MRFFKDRSWNNDEQNQMNHDSDMPAFDQQNANLNGETETSAEMQDDTYEGC